MCYEDKNKKHFKNKKAWLLYNDEIQGYTNNIINTMPSLTLPTITLHEYFLNKNWKDSFKLNLSLFEWFKNDQIKSKTIIQDFTLNSNNKILTDEEFNKIMDYIHKYVDKSIENKLIDERIKTIDEIKSNNELKITKEISQLIANIVHENIISILPSLINPSTITESPPPSQSNDQKNTEERITNIDNSLHQHHYHYELNESDIEKIVEAVRLRLSKDFENFDKLKLSQDNIDEIIKLIKQNIEINNEQYNFIEKIDINEILYKILKSPNLSEFIDTRILKLWNTEKIKDNKLMEEQIMKINEINTELNSIKMKLNNYEIEKNNLKNLYDLFNLKQNEIINKLNSYENKLNENDKYDKILNDLNTKINELNETQLKIINKQVKMYIIEILGIKDDQNIDDINLQEWIKNTFVAKDYLELRLSEFNKIQEKNFHDEIERSKLILMKDITNKMRLELLKMIEDKNINFGLDEKQIMKIVKNSLELYDADKTGLVDYALESAGGQILSTRCTENYHIKSAQISVFGIPLWYPSNTPRIAISPAVQPGECWAFQGFPGFLVLKLNTMIYVTGFTLEHIPKSLAPNGKIDSAPKNFTVWGLTDENDQDPVLFGEYEYFYNGTAWQYFPVQNDKIHRPFDIVELRIESNHGNLAYTCLYRFRVHGTPA